MLRSCVKPGCRHTLALELSVLTSVLRSLVVIVVSVLVPLVLVPLVSWLTLALASKMT